MDILNGKIIYKGEKVFVSNESKTLSSEDVEIVSNGTVTLVLPTPDGTKFDMHIFVKSGTASITGVVDGVTNPSFTASKLEYDVFCDGTAYYTIPTEKENVFTNAKPQLSTIQSYSQAGVIAINTTLMTIDCSDATAISISCLSIGTTGVVTARWKNDIGDTPQNATLILANGNTASTFNAVGIWSVPVFARYLDLVLTTATTAGTTSLKVAKLYGSNPSLFAPAVGTQPISGSLTSAGTTTATPANPTVNTLNSAATTNATSVKTSAGNLYNMAISNTSANPRYLKLYNKASAPTVGTDVPMLTITLPANSFNPINFGVTGFRFATGIALAITGGATDADTTAVGANEVKVLTSYI
jgi:hypothetical protein